MHTNFQTIGALAAAFWLRFHSGLVPAPKGIPNADQYLRALPLCVLICTATGPVTAQSPRTAICGQRDHVVAQLHTRFGEQVRAVGLAGQTRIVEVFASDETGSWTITVTSLDGVTCLLASGQHYESLPPAPPGDRM